MGFDHRKMKDGRRREAEKQAAAKRALAPPVTMRLNSPRKSRSSSSQPLIF
jgi:hypothetical protein